MKTSSRLYHQAAAQIKLSPSLKSLVNSPSSLPSPIPAPSIATTSKLFDSIRARAPSELSRNAWLTVGTAALLTVNSPEAICQLWDYAGRNKEDAGVMREVGLKCISFNGIPRTINGLGALRSHLPEVVKQALPTKSYRQPDETNISRITSQSRALWDAIYTPHHEKLLDKLAASHPDLPVHILNSHYGALLSDPPNLPSPRIGRVLTSVIAITCLRAQRGVGPQLTSHVFGLKKAGIEEGAPQEIEGGEWLCSDEGATWVIESTDRVSEVVTGGQVTFGGPPGQ
ncbi:uncharacterized protein I303_106911 [Kwoniella dejecticola CBS 10117]|uniref:Dol-P-Man:Man(5)GlcNAc(2)-PP-Dol alpha-1,3-mannosyltransferase n=1 Tax=Kwoniella dejecticola CBS 10117 TaxID=1296121 RepID=A0A1A5ZTC4_9TREE|nr:uncharacterized protein I303_08450 [Kwoniella dejecticola CBS 10117]OBR81068.1 hypothetical protein I303_08450 [Kwoniella dejecticola CBS 10117]